jgi:hypothetical protein
MCKSGKICCRVCEEYLKEKDFDTDLRILFESKINLCKDFEECMKEAFKHITFVNYYIGLCEECFCNSDFYLKNANIYAKRL